MIVDKLRTLVNGLENNSLEDLKILPDFLNDISHDLKISLAKMPNLESVLEFEQYVEYAQTTIQKFLERHPRNFEFIQGLLESYLTKLQQELNEFSAEVEAHVAKMQENESQAGENKQNGIIFLHPRHLHFFLPPIAHPQKATPATKNHRAEIEHIVDERATFGDLQTIVVLEKLENNTSVTSINFNDQKIFDNRIKFICYHIVKLQEKNAELKAENEEPKSLKLALSNSRLTDLGVNILLENGLNRFKDEIEYLDLSRNTLTMNSLASFTTTVELAGPMRILDLGSINCQDIGAITLLGALRLSNLEVLNLENNQITSRSIDAILAFILNVTNLKALGLKNSFFDLSNIQALLVFISQLDKGLRLDLRETMTLDETTDESLKPFISDEAREQGLHVNFANNEPGSSMRYLLEDSKVSDYESLFWTTERQKVVRIAQPKPGAEAPAQMKQEKKTERFGIQG